MDYISGNEKTLSFFKEAKRAGRISHAYIIEGAEGSGRLTLARAIAMTVMCKSTGSPCYSCPVCRKIMSGGHQDVRELIQKEKGQVIKIDDLREYIKEAYVKPGESDYKIFIIENAEQMIPATQNAILQIFEEPPKNVIFFLLTTNRNLLLATLKSRAVTFKTEKLHDDIILSRIKSAMPEQSEYFDEALLLADGALGKALAFLSDEASREGVKFTRGYFSLLTEHVSFTSLSSHLNQKSVPDRARLFSTMTYFSMALRDVITRSAGFDGRNSFFTDKEQVRIIADRIERERLLSAYDTVSEIIRDYGKINVLSALMKINMALSDDF